LKTASSVVNRVVPACRLSPFNVSVSADEMVKLRESPRKL
jgi:hypothetical protein